MEYLSNIELYYTLPENCTDTEILINGEECSHILKVMRHNIDDELFVTNGAGQIFRGIIKNINGNRITVPVNKIYQYKNELANITFCIPKLRSTDRFEFALEKCVELGITNFIVFESERTISRNLKIDRWNKILIAAMKQSLRSFLPSLSTVNSFQELINLKGEKLIFDQNAGNKFTELKNNLNKNYYFIFGPEGGFSSAELNFVSNQNLYKLAENRLRTETAIIKCASIL